MLVEGRWHEEVVLAGDTVMPDGRLRLSAFCGPVLEAAGAHASSVDLGVAELQARNLTWMLGRLRVTLAQAPRPGMAVEVTTWPSGVARLFALREFRVTSAEHGEVARATSAWLLVDLKSRRPLRPDAHVERLKVPERALAVVLERLEAPASPAWAWAVVVRPEDIDFNGHVGSVCYLRWIEESLAAQAGGPAALSDLEINYNAEVFLGETLEVVGEAGPRDDGRWAIGLRRASDGVMVAVAAVR